MRVPENVGAGKAQVTISFDAWKVGAVAATQLDIPVTLPKALDFKLAPVSARIAKELIHPNKTSVLAGIRFTPDGRRIVAGDSPGGVVALWEVETGKRLTTIETGKSHRGFSVSPDCKKLYAVRMGKPKTQRVEQDGKPMTRFDFDGSVLSWDLPTGKLHKAFQCDPPRLVYTMGLSPDGNQMVTTDMLPGTYEDQPPMACSLWDTRTGKYVGLGENLRSRGVFSSDGKTLAAATAEKDSFATSLVLLDTSTGKPKLSIPIHEKRAYVSIAGFSPDGKLMLVHYQASAKTNEGTSFPSRFEVLDSTTSKLIASHQAAKDEGFTAKFSPDGQMLAANNYRSFSTKEPKVLLFSIPENRVVKTIVLAKQTKGEWLTATEPVFSPDGKRIAIVTQKVPDTRAADELDALDVPQPRILLIDVPSGEIRETLIAPQGFSRDLCFSPDGRTLAVGSYGRVLLWDIGSTNQGQ